MKNKKSILIITPFFSPNIGGVESHLDDLVQQLNRHKIKSFVLTYSPLTTKTSYLSRENKGMCQIIRFKWFGYQLFPKLEKYPLLDFLYLTPYLLIRSLIWLLSNKNKINVIHSQGFNAAFIGNILSKIFHKKHLCSTHAIYENINGFSRHITVKVLKHTDHILCLSQKSKEQLISWKIDVKKLSCYRHWIDLKRFTPKSPPSNFTALFVGRLIAKKGVHIILKTAAKLPNINFLIVGDGPLQNHVSKFSKKYKNIDYLGALPNSKLPEIYQKSSIFCLASQYPEGFGRTLIEALASGLPVIGSNLGAISEAVDNTVSILFKPTTKNFVNTLEYLSKDKDKYKRLQRNCRPYALKHYSSKNIRHITKHYSSN